MQSQYTPKTTRVQAALDRPLTFTRFPDMRGYEKSEIVASLREMDETIRNIKADSKAELPWFKLATFGDQKSENDCYRTNANTLGVDGVEADYDKEQVTPEEARDLLRQADIAGLIYSTPSHTPDKPRWRVFAPCSDTLPPEDRYRLMARLNGVFDGNLDRVSFTLSQAFYAGGVDSAPQTILVEGRYLDHADDLDEGAIGRPGGAPRERTDGEPAIDQSDIPQAVERAEAALQAAVDRVRAAEDGARTHTLYRQAFLLGGFVACATLDEQATVDALMGAAGDIGYFEDYGKRAARRHITNGLEGGADMPMSWVDWAEDFDEVWAILGITPEVVLSPEEQAEIDALIGPTEKPLFDPASHWAGLPVPPRKWHVDGLIPGNTVTLLGGDGGTGKSLLALQLAVATAIGASWINRGIDQPGKTLVLLAEDDDEELQRRMADICKSQNVPMAALGKLLVRSMAGEDALLAVLDRKTNALKPTPLYAAICETMKRERPRLVILDTLADLHAGNENDRAHGRQFIGMLRHLAIEYDCAVVLLAHPSLTGLNTGTGTSGSTAWSNSVRSRLYLRRVKDEGQEPDPDARILETMKANYGRTGEEIGLTWMHGVFVPDVATREERNTKAESVFLTLLTKFTEQGRTVSHKPSPNYAPTVFAKHPESGGVTKKAFTAAMETLLGNRVIRVGEDGPASRRRSFLEVNS